MKQKFQGILIASDMDGTFLAKNQAGRDRNAEKIAYFQERGGRFTFATGRNYQQLLMGVPNAAELLNLPAVTCNGASLYDFREARELWGCLIDYSIIARLGAFIDEQPETISIRGGTDHGFLYTALNNSYIQMEHDYHKMYVECKVCPVSEWGSYRISKIAVRGTAEAMDRIRPLLAEKFKGELEVTQSATTLIDIQAAGLTKAMLLKRLCEEWSEPPKMLCAVGDYNNDLEMLALADFPCCPDNAIDEVKAVCKKVFCHCNEGVIGDIVDYLDSFDDPCAALLGQDSK